MKPATPVMLNVAVNLRATAGNDKTKDDNCIATLQTVYPINIAPCRNVTFANIVAGRDWPQGGIGTCNRSISHAYIKRIMKSELTIIVYI